MIAGTLTFIVCISIALIIISLFAYLENDYVDNKGRNVAVKCFSVAALLLSLVISIFVSLPPNNKPNNEGHTFIFHNNAFEHSSDCPKCKKQE